MLGCFILTPLPFHLFSTKSPYGSNNTLFTRLKANICKSNFGGWAKIHFYSKSW